MRLIFCLILIFGLQSAFASNDLKTIREFYYKVNLEDEGLEDFETYLKTKANINQAERKGYQAMIWFLKAKDYFNPVNKLEAFNKGKIQLEEVLKSNPDNIELRFLRLTIQDNAPSFLGYNNNIKEDKVFLTSKLNTITDDADLLSRITTYLEKNK